MITLSIPDMSCGHCKASVEGAIAKLDPAAKVTVDLPGRRAEVESAASSEEIIAALVRVGFPSAVA
jgi:copper chaperone